MKSSWVIIFLLASSCATNTGLGLVAGVSVGAGAGGLIGGGNGSMIGGAAGVIAGGLIGAALDEEDRKIVEKSSPRTLDRMDRKEPLTISDIIKLSQSGVNDSAIMQYMHKTQSQYTLSGSQIRRLHDSGVSQRIINYMIDAKNT